MNRNQFQGLIRSHRFLLPPLSGYTDFPFRCILSLFDPIAICTEMVNAKAIITSNHKTMKMIRKEPGLHLKGVQLVGNDPDEMGQAACLLEKSGFDYIDVNMGCTVKKVVDKGQGVALMKDGENAAHLVETIVSSVSLPVTVKIRTGFNHKRKNAVSFAKMLEQRGVSAITVHGRSGEKKFGTTVDYQIIKNIASTVEIPVIANGGIIPENTIEILRFTQADAVMPGRALIGNPWIINHLKAKVNGSSYQIPPLCTRLHIIRLHLMHQCQFYGEKNGIRQFRSILPKYFRHCRYLSDLKDDVRTMTTLSDSIGILDRISEEDDAFVYQ